MFSPEILLIILGIIVGTIGTLIGAGGGFLLVPVLLVMYPDKSPELITGISLAVVCLNALSGSLAYAYKKRIDYRSAFLFSITTLPGSVLGAYLVSFIPRELFNIIFGSSLLALASFLFIKPLRNIDESLITATTKGFWPIQRNVTDRSGKHYQFTYDLLLASILSFFIGMAASILGIGGGIIHVPVMVNLLHFPVHLATATSHFILALMGIGATTTHYVQGDLDGGIQQIIYIGIGVIAGAQLGAAVSHKLKGVIIIRCLAIAIGLVALRIFWMSFFRQ